jgi:hypothetical protein
VLSGRIEEGCADLDRAFPMLVDALGEEHLHVAEAAFWLATCRGMLGREDEASSLYDRSLSLRSSLRGEDDADVRFARACGLAHLGEGQAASALVSELAGEGYRNSLAHLYPHFETLPDKSSLAEIAAPP